MATLTLRPDAGGFNTNFRYSPDGITGYSPDVNENYKQVDEAVADDDANFVFHSGTQNLDTYNIPDSSPLGVISAITVYNRAKKFSGTSGLAAAAIRTYSTNYPGTARTLTASYVTRSHSWATNPNTGYPWTWAEINALEIGVYLNPSNANLRCTQIYVVIAYTALLSHSQAHIIG